MKLFHSESEARQYLEVRVPPKEKDKKVDLSALKEKLFDVPENISPGHHEFEGANGYKVSFDLAPADFYFDDCWSIYKGIHEPDESSDVTGGFHPIYAIDNLEISTPNFSQQRAAVGRHMQIIWMPNLRSVNPEQSHNFSHVDHGEIYLIGGAGFFSRPADLFSFFHEAGHIATRTPETLVNERNSVKRTITTEGITTEPLKKAALELQRERDANAWVLLKTRKLFADLGIPGDRLQEYIRRQLESYYAVNRKRLENLK